MFGLEFNSGISSGSNAASSDGFWHYIQGGVNSVLQGIGQGIGAQINTGPSKDATNDQSTNMPTYNGPAATTGSPSPAVKDVTPYVILAAVAVVAVLLLKD